MPYQLPPELRTSKLNSLPDDLREIAEAALAAKFDIPEITVKKTAPKKEELRGKKVEADYMDERRPLGYPEMVTIIVKTDRMMASPVMPMGMYDGNVSMSAQVEMERYPYYKQQAVSIPPHMYGVEVAELLEKTLRRMLEQMKYEGARMSGGRDCIILGYEGKSMEINSYRDIEEFVMRYRVGDGRGRY